MDHASRRSRARARALRAARAVTMAAALGSSALACGGGRETTETTSDVSGNETGSGGERDGVATGDPASTDDAPCAGPLPSDERCCARAGGRWMRPDCVVVIPGPFGPPADRTGGTTLG